MNMAGKIASVAALAAGGVLLAGRVQRERVVGPMGGSMASMLPSAPLLETEQTLHLRLPARATLGAALALAAGGYLLSRQMSRQQDWGSGSGSQSVSQSIDVDVPVSTAYNQFTQFEEFPKFMDTVEEVRQVDDTHLHWRAVVAGKPKEWDAEITEQIPDKRIAWRSTSGVRNAGVVTFHKLSDNRTRVMMQMDYEPDTLVERVGGAMGGVKQTARGNLQRFKKLIEGRGVETGAWRGTVPMH